MKLINLRNRHFLMLDIIIFSLTPTFALMLRLDKFSIPESFVNGLLVYTATVLGVRLTVSYWFGLYRRYWRYASIDELVQIGLAAGAAFIIIVPLFFLWRLLIPSLTFARSVIVIDGMLTVLATGVIRFSVRWSEKRHRQRPSDNGRRVLVVGAGDAGAMVVQELQKNLHRGLNPVGFIDDDPDKQHMRIHGIPVLGMRQDIPHVVPDMFIDQVVIAMPTAPGMVIRAVVETCERLGIKAKTIPAIYELLDGAINVNQLRDVDIEDLLRREPVQTDIAAVRTLIKGKRILITGGGGSIGSELCRQVMRCDPAQLVIMGHGENSIFEIYNELRILKLNGSRVKPVIADIRFPDLLLQIFEQYRPQIVFHAAAHKHVPLMEMNPAEAITNNVIGTRNLVDVALSVGVERFVMVSTDKAVNPTSVMGASKRAAELLVHQAAQKSSRPYVAVRFGNVLGSRGSVVLTFKRQIAAGGPITVTDPEMKRYFMTIPEAVQLVLQAAVLGEGGEMFLLDMGDPMKIVDLARDLIELSGLEVGRDIEIKFTGIRAGEKLFEELFIPGEDYHRTKHQKIFIAGNASSFVPDQLDNAINGLAASARRNDSLAILRGLQALIPEYQPVENRDNQDATHIESQEKVGKLNVGQQGSSKTAAATRHLS